MKYPCSQIYEDFVPDLGSKKRRPRRVSFIVLLVVVLGLHFLTQSNNLKGRGQPLFLY
jgi:hypothetical protein